MTPWIAACQASLSITNSRSSPRLTSIESVMSSSHLILCCPLLLLPPIPPSFRVFSNASTLCMRWPKYWSFSFSIIPSKEIPRLISFRMDWLDLLAVQGTSVTKHKFIWRVWEIMEDLFEGLIYLKGLGDNGRFELWTIFWFSTFQASVWVEISLPNLLCHKLVASWEACLGFLMEEPHHSLGT